MKYLLFAVLLLLINYLYSAYSLSVSREYARKVTELKRERERGLLLQAEIERYVNYRTAKSYAESAGLGPVDWSKVKVVKFSP